MRINHPKILDILPDKMATVKSPQVAAPLLTLPPEIRNKIFTLVLTRKQSHPAFSNFDARGEFGSWPQSPPLAEVCRQLRQEAIPILYGANTFKFLAFRQRYDLINTDSHRQISPNEWLDGFQAYNPGVTVHVGKLTLRSYTASIDPIARSARWSYACACTFRKEVGKFVREADPLERALQALAEHFYWKLRPGGDLHRPDLFAECEDATKNHKGRGKTTFIHVNADGTAE